MPSKKVLLRIENPTSVGHFTEEEAIAKRLRLAVGYAGSFEKGNRLALFFLVDEEDGVISDCKFQVFGPPMLIGAAESAATLSLRKNILQVKRISAQLLDKEMQDKNGKNAFDEEDGIYLNLVLDALDEAMDSCMDIPIAESYVAPPEMGDGQTFLYPNWNELTEAQKKSVLDGVIEEEVKPYVELDAGGVEITKIVGNEITVTFSGNCTSCFSATGSTLEAIGQILRAKVYPELVVMPDLSVLSQGS